MSEIKLKPATQIKLEQFADITGQSIDEIVNSALNEHLQRLADRQLETEIKAFERLHAKLKEQYLGQFVAVHLGQVVDTDVDFEALFLRVNNRFGEKTVLIRQVTDSPNETYNFHEVHLEPEP